MEARACWGCKNAIYGDGFFCPTCTASNKAQGMAYDQEEREKEEARQAGNRRFNEGFNRYPESLEEKLADAAKQSGDNLLNTIMEVAERLQSVKLGGLDHNIGNHSTEDPHNLLSITKAPETARRLVVGEQEQVRPLARTVFEADCRVSALFGLGIGEGCGTRDSRVAEVA